MNQTQSLSIDSIDNKKLVNFLAPKYLLSIFDDLAKSNGTNRTHVIIQSMKNYIKSEVANIENIEKFNKKLLDVISDKFESKLDEKLNKALENPDLNFEVPNIPLIVKEDPFDPKVWLEVGSKGYYNDE